jgi:hypothetical protein
MGERLNAPARFLPSTPVGALAFSAAGIGVYSLAADGLLSPKAGLVLLTLAMVGFLAVELARLRAESPGRWLLNPPVLATFLVFLLPFGFGNALFLMPEEKVALVALLPDVTPSILKLMLLVLLAAAAMWLGYRSPLPGKVAGAFRSGRVGGVLLREGFDIRPRVIGACLALCLASRLILIRLEIYGYSADPVRLLETASYRQYLSLLESLGKLALFLVALRFFSAEDRGRRDLPLLAGITLFELLFGFLSGFKSAVAMPFVILGVVFYLATGRISRRIAAMFVLSLLAAYAVIEPFRAARHAEDDFRGTDVNAIAMTMIRASLSDPEGGVMANLEERAGTGLALLARTSQTQVASLGIEFADTSPLPDGSPAFGKDIFLAPFYAVVPRAIWKTKEMARHGTWYSQVVMGNDDSRTSVAMTPFTYLYFAGGFAAVVAGFGFVGALQRFVREAFMSDRPSGALIVFVFLLPVVSLVDSAFYDIITSGIRMLIAGIAVQAIVLRDAGAA